jgi:aminopeptidase
MALTIQPRDQQLAKMLINYSVKAQPGQLVFIHVFGQDALSLGAACVEEAARAGAAPYLHFTDNEIQRRFLRTASDDVFSRLAQLELKQMQDADCYIGIRGAQNIFEMSDVPREKMDAYNRLVAKPVHLEERVKRTKWVVLRYPTESFAQMASSSTEAFRDFYYDVCLVDYEKMGRDVEPLKTLMDRTDKIKITGPGTDLELSIKDIPSIPCCGEMNVPDGECFTAPVRESVNGTVQFNTPAVQQGMPFDNVRLRFENGKVVEATAADAIQTRKLNEILDQDPGARYLGEFAIGINPKVMHPMRDTLFDEKIAGSFHMALGQCYDEAPNGNQSALHWDMVCIQRPDYGGGEMYFDAQLIRKDGQFVPDDLKPLNWQE